MRLTEGVALPTHRFKVDRLDVSYIGSCQAAYPEAVVGVEPNVQAWSLIIYLVTVTMAR